MAANGNEDGAGVLFDVDGTLLDTPYIHAVTWSEALRQQGHQVPTAVIHRAIGMGSDKLLDHLLGEDRDTDHDDELLDAHLTLYKQYWGRLQPLPGARDLLQWCAEHGLRVVLASSASEEELGALRSALDADEFITAATSSADADNSKPAPDIVEAALDQSGVDPATAVFVGDAVWDGQAAGKAGLRFIALECGGTSEAELRENGAVEVWRDPAHLLQNVAGSLLSGL